MQTIYLFPTPTSVNCVRRKWSGNGVLALRQLKKNKIPRCSFTSSSFRFHGESYTKIKKNQTRVVIHAFLCNGHNPCCLPRDINYEDRLKQKN